MAASREDRPPTAAANSSQDSRTIRWLKAVNSCLLTTGAAPQEKIRQLVCLGLDLLGAQDGYYNRIAGETPCSTMTRSGLGSCAPSARLCQEVIARSGEQLLLIPDITRLPYAELLPEHIEAGLRCYLGCKVICDGQLMGCLCLFFDREQQLTEDDQALLETLTAAIGVEEERWRAQDALRLSELKYQSLFDRIRDIFFRADKDGRIMLVSPAVERVLGYSPEEAQGLELTTLSQNPIDQDQVAALLQHGLPIEHYDAVLKAKDGSLVWLQTNLYPVRDPQDEIIGIEGIARDITRAERSREALRQSEERYRLLVENAPLGVLTIDTQGKISEVNSAMVTMLGSPSPEVTRRINLLTFPLLVESGIAADFRRCLETDELIVAEHPYRSAWGKDALFRYHLRPIYDSAAEISGVQAIVEDITAYRRAEQQRQELEEQLNQAQKMEAIGQLAGGIAHDMNNLLGAILGLASLLHFEMDPEDAWRSDLEGIISACRKGRDLTRNLLGFARRGKYLKEPVLLNQVVAEVQELLGRTIPKKIALEAKLLPELPPVEGDPSQLNQALMNVCLNAVDAVGEDGRIVVRSRLAALSREDLVGQPDLSPGEYCCLEVADTGCGMTPEQLRQAFEPFFTTKPQGKGTGLGLSMVYGTVKSHGGQVTIDSKPGQGSVVSIYLPALAASSAVPECSEQAPLQELAPSGRILVVDDEPGVRESCSRMLAALGHTVLLAAHGRQAIELYQQQAEEIGLVILDLVMPVMDGEETFRRLKDLHPQVKVLLASGYSQEHKADQLLAQGAVGFLQKPFELEALAQALTRALAPTS